MINWFFSNACTNAFSIDSIGHDTKMSDPCLNSFTMMRKHNCHITQRFWQTDWGLQSILSNVILTQVKICDGGIRLQSCCQNLSKTGNIATDYLPSKLQRWKNPLHGAQGHAVWSFGVVYICDTIQKNKPLKSETCTRAGHKEVANSGNVPSVLKPSLGMIACHATFFEVQVGDETVLLQCVR